jgi:hypothetical protein
MPWRPLLETSVIILVLLGYPYLIWRLGNWLAKLLRGLHFTIRCSLLALYYALFLGIGIWCTGGDSGVGLPAPMAVCLLFTLSGWLSDLLLFSAWYVLFFGILLLMHLRSARSTRK